MKKDILNRTEFVNMIMDFCTALSTSQKGCCFAIDGKWGSGKTFVLEMLEEQMREYQSEETEDNQFFVFHYNCWQYDYYEEPSIAIVSAMKDAIDDEKSFLGTEMDEKIKAGFEIVKKEVKKMAGKFAEKHIGINVVEVWDEMNKIQKKGEEKSNKYDSLFEFKKALDEVRVSLQTIAKEKTLVFVVDELDRCIPTYAIKVLERLHHMFDGIDNVIVIISVDATQLSHSIKEIYGEETQPKDYLKKIISMTFELDAGKIQQGIFEKYASFFSMFNEPADHEIEEIEDIFAKVWLGIDMRTQEKLMEKAEAIHSLVTNEKVDVSMALFEILIVRFQNTYNAKSLCWLPEINKAHYVHMEEKICKETIDYLKYLQERACSNHVVMSGVNRGKEGLLDDVVGNTFWLLSNVYCTNQLFYSEAGDKYDKEVDLAKGFRKFIDIVQ